MEGRPGPQREAVVTAHEGHDASQHQERGQGWGSHGDGSARWLGLSLGSSWLEWGREEGSVRKENGMGFCLILPDRVRTITPHKPLKKVCSDTNI